MSGAWSTPLDIMANVLERVQQDPQASQIMKGVGLAHDVSVNAPPDVVTPITHYEWEAEEK